jgi:hypothetical protein
VIDVASLAVRYAEGRRLALAAKEMKEVQPARGKLRGRSHRVLGLDYRGAEQPVSVGVRVLDTRTWSSTTIDEHAQLAAVAGTRLLVWSWGPSADPQRWVSQGLRVVGADGLPTSALFDGRSVGWVQPVGAVALVTLSGRDGQAAVVDLRSGEVVTRAARPPEPLVGAGQAIYG